VYTTLKTANNGHGLSLEDIVDYAQAVDRTEALNLILNISRMVEDHWLDPAAVNSVAKALYEETAHPRTLRLVIRDAEERHGVTFTNHQLLVATKLILDLEPVGKPRPVDGRFWTWLFAIPDYLETLYYADLKKYGKEVAARNFAWRNLLLNHVSNLRLDVTRGYYMYEKVQECGVLPPNALDTRTLVKDLLGLTPAQFYALNYLIRLSYECEPVTSLLHAPCVDESVAEKVGMDTDPFRKMMADASYARTNESFSMDKLESGVYFYEFEAIRRRPFVDLGASRWLPVNLFLLSSWTGTALFWVMLDGLAPANKDALFHTRGPAFQEYCSSLFQSAATRPGTRAFPERELMRLTKRSGGLPDLIVEDDGSVIVLELHASEVALSRMLGGQLDEDVDKMVASKVPQLLSYIKEIREGGPLAVEESWAEAHLVPLVGTLGALPAEGAIREYVRSRCEDLAELESLAGSPMGFVSAQELEWMAASLSEAAVTPVLDGWLKAKPQRSLLNHIVAAYLPAPPTLPFTRQLLKEVADQLRGLAPDL